MALVEAAQAFFCPLHSLPHSPVIVRPHSTCKARAELAQLALLELDSCVAEMPIDAKRLTKDCAMAQKVLAAIGLHGGALWLQKSTWLRCLCS